MSMYVRLRDAKNGYVNCVTCDKVEDYRDMDAGHFIPKTRGNAAYFDPINVHPQCKECNLQKQGNGYLYTLFMREKYGHDEIQALHQRVEQLKKYSVADFLELEAHYKTKLKELQDE